MHAWGVQLSGLREMELEAVQEEPLTGSARKLGREDDSCRELSHREVQPGLRRVGEGREPWFLAHGSPPHSPAAPLKAVP